MSTDDGDLLLVAVVEMVAGRYAEGIGYEDAVLRLFDRHGGALQQRLRGVDSATEVQVIRFRSRAGLEAFLVDPERLALREQVGDAAPTTRVIEVTEV